MICAAISIGTVLSYSRLKFELAKVRSGSGSGSGSRSGSRSSPATRMV